MRAADYLMPGGPLARAVPGWEHRPAQLEMAEAVQRVLENDGVAIIEAGTGTGKTLAYLLPAALAARRVVVSTGTRTLQDQIVDHDLPALEAHLGLAIRAACMKGLSNYLCLRRLEELRDSPEALRPPLSVQLPVVGSWRQRTPSGDRADLLGLAEDAAIWHHVASSSETRIGARCKHYDDCFVTQMRRRADEAQIIVVNHHLFFADLATRGPHGGIIPDYEAVIFDEAHQIEDVATQFFGVRIATGRFEVLVRDAGRAFRAAAVDALGAGLTEDTLAAAARFFQGLPRESGGDGARRALAPEDFSGALEQHGHSLDTALEGLAAFAGRHAVASEAVAQIARRAAQLRDDLATVMEGSHGGRVAWCEIAGRRATVGASPVDVSDLLREELFHRTPAVVLTSATLSTGGTFDFVERRVGIDFEVDELRLPSPFDWPTQAALYLPDHVPEPRDPRYARTAADEIRALVEVTGGGAFVLCTSLRMMRELAERIRPHLDHELLVQGEAPKGLLLDRFRDVGDAVLFATASFWQGVDVPGDALRLVIIDKLPFDVPSDPLVVARCERLREEGQQPFMKYLVPAAALSLKQGFGRLVRSRRDRGVVAILDSRIVRRGYGRVFIDSLPPATRCAGLDEVVSFWQAG